MKENANLLKEDFRFYAIGTLNDGVAMIATIENLNGENISFGLPTSTGMFLNLSLRSRNKIKNTIVETLFNKKNQGAWPDDHTLLFDFFESMISQVVFAYSSIETFANVTINQKT